MSLTGIFESFDGLAGDGSWLGNNTEHVKAADLNKLRNSLRMAAAGSFGGSLPVGGSLIDGLVGTSALDAINAIEFVINNSSGYLTSSTGFSASLTIWCRVESTGVSFTPRLYNVTDAAVVTTTGAVACTATNADYSGTNQKQTFTFAPASGVKTYKIQGTPTSSTGQVWFAGWRSQTI